jgi:hypothetical protein
MTLGVGGDSTIDPGGFRFEVAFSFAGDGKRDKVREVARVLRDELGDGHVFFDEWFEAELAGPDAQIVLQQYYRSATRLVVACVCDRYGEKPWTQEEWRAIQSLERGLRDAGSANLRRLRFLPLRFGDGQVDGLLDTAIVPDVRHRSTQEVADLILERLRLARGDGAPQQPLIEIRAQSGRHKFLPSIGSRRTRLALASFAVFIVGTALTLVVNVDGGDRKQTVAGKYECRTPDVQLRNCRISREIDQSLWLTFEGPRHNRTDLIDRYRGQLEPSEIGFAVVVQRVFNSRPSDSNSRRISTSRLTLSAVANGELKGTWVVDEDSTPFSARLENP